ncbi:MAG: glycoside hydrolase family 43 protein [Planctomycetota bacterium]
MSKTIDNPILSGFNPDPSILRVGDDFYIATSTFEWFPGVQVHHSRDLVNWRLLTRPLDRVSQLDMRGIGNSCGVWAPCLSYDEDAQRFYLIYTIVRSRGHFKDTPNFLVTAESIHGPWSEPTYLNASGFDPSLFHDDDGRKWLVNMVWDPRGGVHPFAGILLQEYNAAAGRLVGPVKNIFQGTALQLVEGPHLYKRSGWYYLLTAEGGTMHEHAVTLARSRSIDGPYEVHPQNPVLTADGHDELELRKAGHASLVETQDGRWYMAHLCGRPVPPSGRCILGRETALQEVRWDDDGWLRLTAGGNTPRVRVPAPDLPLHPFSVPPARDDFDEPTLRIDYQTPRVPLDTQTCSLTARRGWLRLFGGESLASPYYQSHVARRVQHHRCAVRTCVDFEPEHFQHFAGLTAYYDTESFYFLGVTYCENHGRCLTLFGMDRGEHCEFPDIPVSINHSGVVHLGLDLNGSDLQFIASPDAMSWYPVGPKLDASILSDEHPKELGFTGAFVGLSVQDMAGASKSADFDYFEYRPLQTEAVKPPAARRLRRMPSSSL